MKQRHVSKWINLRYPFLKNKWSNATLANQSILYIDFTKYILHASRTPLICKHYLNSTLREQDLVVSVVLKLSNKIFPHHHCAIIATWNNWNNNRDVKIIPSRRENKATLVNNNQPSRAVIGHYNQKFC